MILISRRAGELAASAWVQTALPRSGAAASAAAKSDVRQYLVAVVERPSIPSSRGLVLQPDSKPHRPVADHTILGRDVNHPRGIVAADFGRSGRIPSPIAPISPIRAKSRDQHGSVPYAFKVSGLRNLPAAIGESGRRCDDIDVVDAAAGIGVHHAVDSVAEAAFGPV